MAGSCSRVSIPFEGLDGCVICFVLCTSFERPEEKSRFHRLCEVVGLSFFWAQRSSQLGLQQGKRWDGGWVVMREFWTWSPSLDPGPVDSMTVPVPVPKLQAGGGPIGCKEQYTSLTFLSLNV